MFKIVFNVRALKKALEATDKIITPALTEWLVVHGDEALEHHVAQRIYDLLTTKPRYRGDSFSGSGSGACQRAQVYGYLDQLQRLPDPQLAMIFMDGKWRHLRWQAIGLSIGLFDDVEHPLKWPNQRSVGNVDGHGIVPEDHPRFDWRGKEFGFELKGVSTFQFSKYKDTMPMSKHLDQVADYFLSSGWELFVVVYEDKTTQAWYEWVIEADHPDMQARIEKRQEELKNLNNYVETQTLPPRLPVCERLRGTTFQNCPYGHDRTGTCARITEWPTRRRK